MDVRVVGDVQQDEHGHVPQAGALQLRGVAGVEESLPLGAQVGVVQGLQDAPQVPAQAVVQALPGDRQRVQQLLQAVVSAGRDGGREAEESHSVTFTSQTPRSPLVYLSL